MQNLRIAYVTSEAVPFAKTGGLADVSGILPGEIRKLGHDSRMFMPLYGSIDRNRFKIENINGTIEGFVGKDKIPCRLLSLSDLDKEYHTYFIENDKYFNREALYVDPKPEVDSFP